MVRTEQITPKRGDVYLAVFDPIVGLEIGKTRPAVIIQNDLGNQYAPTVIVAAISSRGTERYPVDVAVARGDGGLSVDSFVALSQIRTFDKSRLRKKLGTLSKERMQLIDIALQLSLGVGGI